MTQLDDQRYSISEFIEQTRQQDRGQGLFELESRQMLEVNLDGLVWMKKGAMIAYVGDIKFEREGILEHGVGKLLKKAFTGEGAQLTKATGAGRLYIADSGKEIQILDLAGEAIHVNGNDLLAFQDGLSWDIKFLKRVSSMMAGGLFNVRIEGDGLVAVTSHFEPMALIVKPGQPVITDPNATIAWSGGLSPTLKTDIQLKSLIGRGSGESFQMQFEGDGWVVVQPYEETYYTAAQSAGG
ncbi:MAG: AIM24 family protein [Planctomycetota bacterium]